jgi:hypothetical protein
MDYWKDILRGATKSGKNRNILLLLNQCAAYNTEILQLKHIQLLYLPAKQTAIII